MPPKKMQRQGNSTAPPPPLRRSSRHALVNAITGESIPAGRTYMLGRDGMVKQSYNVHTLANMIHHARTHALNNNHGRPDPRDPFTRNKLNNRTLAAINRLARSTGWAPPVFQQTVNNHRVPENLATGAAMGRANWNAMLARQHQQVSRAGLSNKSISMRSASTSRSRQLLPAHYQSTVRGLLDFEKWYRGLARGYAALVSKRRALGVGPPYVPDIFRYFLSQRHKLGSAAFIDSIVYAHLGGATFLSPEELSSFVPPRTVVDPNNHDVIDIRVTLSNGLSFDFTVSIEPLKLSTEWVDFGGEYPSHFPASASGRNFQWKKMQTVEPFNLRSNGYFNHRGFEKILGLLHTGYKGDHPL